MKKVLIFILSLVFIMACSNNKEIKDNSVEIAKETANAQSTTVILHYNRYEKDFDNINLRAWTKGSGGAKDFSIISEDDFGKVFLIKFDKAYDKIGFTIKKSGKKEYKSNIYVENIKDGFAEAWLLQDNEKPYYTNKNIDTRSKIFKASLEGIRKIEIETSNRLLNTGLIKITDEVKEYKIKNVEKKELRNYVLYTEENLDMSKKYTITIPEFKEKETQMGRALLEPLFYYHKDDLGNTYKKGFTEFKVWTPVAENLELVIYENSNDKIGNKYIMDKSRNGVWDTKIGGDLKNKQYNYLVTIYGKTIETVDPYAKALNTNSKRGIIVDLKETNPENWENDKKPFVNNISETNNYEDHIIWEVQVRDFSISEHSGMKNKGKYLAFSELGTHLEGKPDIKTGIDHLKELGITTVHLNPVYDFATVDESGKDKEKYYNWGYDPYQYNVPEGSYATNPDDITRIKEFKTMVQALHNAGMRVVMDVVYNHTFSTGDSLYDQLVPKYYYRMYPNGTYANGSGCGNEVATEKPMVRKFIIDSLKYWVNEYHIDGFRFDLMGIMDKETMGEIEKELHAIDSSLLLYGEPWGAGNTGIEEKDMFVKGSQKGSGIAVFNDNIRDAIKGGNNDSFPGFVMGKKNNELKIKRGIVGTIDYNDKIKDFTADPGESINYASCHDNLTLWDKLRVSMPKSSEAEKLQVNKLAQTIVLTSQGIPLILAGEEITRDKNRNHNSYRAGDEDNKIRWDRKENYLDLFNYYSGLIDIRKNHKAFRMTEAEDIRKNIKFYEQNELSETGEKVKSVIAYKINGGKLGDEWREIIVIFNAKREAFKFKMSKDDIFKEWTVVLDNDEAGLEAVKTAVNDSVKDGKFTGKTFLIPASTAIIMKR